MTFEALPDDLPGLPMLLRAARGSFASAIRVAMAAADMPALPTNGPFILGGLHADPDSLEQLVGQRRRSIEKYQTIDKLLEAGYLSGSHDDPVLTDRGHDAAHIIYGAIDGLTTSLNEWLGDDGMKSFVRGLLFLISDKQSREES
ncbi:MAG: hypothetical protein WA359_08810 [Acidimicrobiales bacterium]